VGENAPRVCPRDEGTLADVKKPFLCGWTVKAGWSSRNRNKVFFLSFFNQVFF
jgi:hypothetical protein